MARLKCPCGEVLTNTGIPNEVEGILLRDIDLEWIGNDSVNLLEIDGLGRDIWECSSCGRLAISWPQLRGSLVKWYWPEDGNPGDLMKFKRPG